MLILTRKRGQTIYIGDEVKVTVLNGDRENVRIGITAPNSVAVHREEVYKKIQVQNQKLKAS